jgi:hypothetical protein
VANLRTQVAKAVISGTLGPSGTAAEIWSTSFWIAAYASGSVTDMAGFEGADYITNHVSQFVKAFMGQADPMVQATLIKCNVFGLSGGKPKQVEGPTIQTEINITGGQESGGGTFVTAFGWGLSSSTAGKRGIATKGRMFLPTMGSNTYGNYAMDNLGHWTGTVQNAVSAAVSPAWDLLSAAGGSGAGGGVTYLPSLVALPNTKAATTEFSVNAADVTTAEANVWVVRTRKSALESGGVVTNHPSFS